MSVKQTLIWRNDLKVRRGKEDAQIAHSSIMWLSKRVMGLMEECERTDVAHYLPALFTKEELEWMAGSFTKICLQVDNEAQLDEVYERAKAAGLLVELVIDAGRTEFNGVPTKTCIAIGPNRAEDIDKITSELKLH